MTQEELDRIYSAPKYTKGTPIKWRSHDLNRYDLDVPVIMSTGETLRVVGNYSPCSRRDVGYSFSLLYRNSILIRRWDCAPNHGEPPYSHKHKENKEIYEVDDICLVDVNQAFVDFLKECNIRLSGSYTGLLYRQT